MKKEYWKDVYKLPIKYDGWGYSFSKNDVMSLDFEDCAKNYVSTIVGSINGTIKANIPNLTHEGPDFFIEGDKAFSVRGWGHLIGIGGLHLSESEAKTIQDGFIDHVYKSLTTK